jgi:hypothetical protein
MKQLLLLLTKGLACSGSRQQQRLPTHGAAEAAAALLQPCSQALQVEEVTTRQLLC